MFWKENRSRAASLVGAEYTPESGRHGSALGIRNASVLVLCSTAHTVITTSKRPTAQRWVSLLEQVTLRVEWEGKYINSPFSQG